MQDGIAPGGERDKEDIFPARDFILRKRCWGAGKGTGPQPALLGSEEQSVLLWRSEEDEEGMCQTGLTLGCVMAG